MCLSKKDVNVLVSSLCLCVMSSTLEDNSLLNVKKGKKEHSTLFGVTGGVEDRVGEHGGGERE